MIYNAFTYIYIELETYVQWRYSYKCFGFASLLASLWLCIACFLWFLQLLIEDLSLTCISKAAFSEDQISGGAAEPLCPPNPSVCLVPLQAVHPQWAPTLEHAIASFWNNLQTLFFLIVVTLEANVQLSLVFYLYWGAW